MLLWKKMQGFSYIRLKGSIPLSSLDCVNGRIRINSENSYLTSENWKETRDLHGLGRGYPREILIVYE